MMRRVMMVAGVVLAALCASEPAKACGACLCDGPEALAQPLLPLIRDLPLNLALTLRKLDEETPPRLERVADGGVVPTRVEPDPTGMPFWKLVVERDLEPNTAYRVVRDSGVDAEFTTASARDEQAPTLATVTAQPGGNGGLCEPSLGAQVELAGAEDGAAFAVWMELEADVDGTPQRLYRAYSFGPFGIGSSEMDCFGDASLSGIVEGATYHARLRLHDAADNVSEWQAFDLPIVAEEPAGCGGPSPSDGGASNAPESPEPPSPNPDNPEPELATNEATSQSCGCSVPSSGASSFGAALALLGALLGRARARRTS
jgi:hypothetical protein